MYFKASKLTFLIICFSILFFFLQDRNYKPNNLDLTNTQIVNCNSLDYEKSLILKSDNFSAFDIGIEVYNERKWKKNLLQNLQNYRSEGSFPNKGKNKSKVFFKKNNLVCFSEAYIKPHGDFEDHHMDLFTRNLYELPSVKIDLIENHFFGITKFILFRPQARNYNNEVLITTILRQIGKLAPRTANVNVQYNLSNEKFIFQERLNKEFLEYNNLIEGPIIKGDERFAFKYSEIQNYISKHRLSNAAWSFKNENNFSISKKVLNILNFSNHFYVSNFPADKIIDYYTANKNSMISNYFVELPVFDALMYSLSSTHYLSRDERRFYFDSVNKKFYPIYYDGSGKILDRKNNINEKFINIRENWYYAMLKNIDDTVLAEIKSHITGSAKKGSSKAIDLVENLNLFNLKKELELLNFKISDKKINEIIQMILNNLYIIKNIEDQKLIKSKNIFSTDIYDKVKKVNANYVLDNKNNQNYTLCDLSFKNCKTINLEETQKKQLIQQRLSLQEMEYIYLGSYEDFKNKKIEVINNNSKKNIINDLSLEFINIGNNIIEYNKDKSTIYINKINKNGRVVFINQSLKNLTLVFNDLTKRNNIFDITRDTNGLTGCLNVFDSKIENINIYSNNSNCEDSVNIVRSNGSINNVLINNSISDGLDLDFSEIKIENISVKKAQGDCLDVSYGSYMVNNSKFSNCLDKALSAGEKSNVNLKTLIADKSNIGVASKDYSEVYIEKLNMKNVNICLNAYNKKNEFSGGYIVINYFNCNINNANGIQMNMDNRSNIIIKKYN